jgi:hypothetical protein
MSIRQSKLIRIAVQHGTEAHVLPSDIDDGRTVEIEVPYAAYTHTETGQAMPAGSDYERVSSVEELLAVLGY